MTEQQGFCPRCGQHGPLHELHKDDGTYRRFRKTNYKPELYCERCIDRIKHQQAIDRRDAAMRRFDRDKKYGRAHHAW